MKLEIIVICCFPIFSLAQIPNFTFFKSSENNEGISHALAMLPAQIDSTLQVDTFYRKDVFLIKYVVDDTLYFDGKRVLIPNSKLPENIDFLDTIHQIIEGQPRRVYQHFERCNGGFEWVKECYEKVPQLKKWTPREDKKIMSSHHWALKINPEYAYRYKYYKYELCHVPFEEIPAKYHKIILASPNRSLNDKESKHFKDLSQAYYAYQFQEIKYEIKDENKMISSYKYHLRLPARIGRVEVYSEKEILAKLDVLNVRLMALNYLKEKSNRIDDALKKAILEYQMENGLPIGQFDKQSIGKLLE